MRWCYQRVQQSFTGLRTKFVVCLLLVAIDRQQVFVCLWTCDIVTCRRFHTLPGLLATQVHGQPTVSQLPLVGWQSLAIQRNSNGCRGQSISVHTSRPLAVQLQ